MWTRLLSLKKLFSLRPVLRRRPTYKLTLEAFEDRCLLSANVLQTNLVSDLPDVAQQTDPQLVNPWGISTSSGSPFWVSDNGAGVSTLYNSTGVKQSLVTTIPTPPDPLGASGTPTGTVFNTDGGASGGFKVNGVSATGAPITAAAIFLFDTEDGTIIGWNPGVNPKGFNPAMAGTYGVIAVDNSGNNFTNSNPAQETGAVYKGLAIAPTSATPIIASDPNSLSLLYASNFRAGTIEVYDTSFNRPTLAAGAFTDSALPTGYAPFNVQVLNGHVYVTYALQDAFHHDDAAGAGHGFVDVYNLDGSGDTRLISHGPLNSPWGLAIAPARYGAQAGDLLVGNFGNGQIHAFNLSGTNLSNNFTTLKDPDGEPIQIDGLWGLRVGNGGNGGDANLVYFSAGLFGESHGLFGSLTAVAPGTPEGPAENQMVTAALDVVQLDLNTLAMDISTSQPEATIHQDLTALRADTVQFVQFENQFLDGTNAPPPAITYLNGTLFITDLSNGNDNVMVSPAAGGGVTVSSNSGSATFASVNAVLVSLRGGNHNVYIANLPGVSVTVDVLGGNSNNNINIGNEAATVVAVGGGNNNIHAGTGQNIIVVTGNGNSNISADGVNDSIDVTGNGNHSINDNGSGATITLDGNGNRNINTGPTGPAQIFLVGNGNANINVGAGQNIIVVTGNGNVNINADGVNDSIEVTGNGNHNINDNGSGDLITIIGNGNNNVNNDGTGSFTIHMGTGNNHIHGPH